jgi:haloalkane dehalogenase
LLVLAVLAPYVVVLLVGGAAAQQPSPRRPLVYHGLTVPSVPFASKYVRVRPGRQMHYYEAGQPDGPPVLLLHGVPTWAYLWRKVIPRLDDRGHRIIAVDLIGFGLSDRPENLTYDLGDHRRYLERFVRALGLRNLTLVGHDIGGAVGLDFATRHRGDVRALALMETFLPPVTDGQLPPLQQGLAAILADPAATRELLLNQNLLVEQAFRGPPTTLNPLARRDHDAYRAVLPRPEDRRVLPPVPRQLLRAHTRSIQRTVRRYLGWLARTRVPVLYAYGNPGLLHAPSTLAWARASIRNLTTVHVGRSGHFLQEDQPHHLAHALRRWLARAVPERKRLSSRVRPTAQLGYTSST